MAVVDRSTRKTTILAWLEAITASTIGAGDGMKVYWRGAPESAGVKPAVYAIAYLGVPTTVGRDEIAHEYDDAAPAGAEMTHSQGGQRRITLDVQIWSSRSSGADDAAEYARRITDRACLDDWDDDLADAGVAFVEVAANQPLGVIQTSDGREHVVHQLDIILNAETLESGAAAGYIEIVDDAEMEAPEGTSRWTGDLSVG